MSDQASDVDSNGGETKRQEYVALYKGEVIHNRYRLDRLIDTGGMGQVWMAHDIQNNRTVAIKTRRGDIADVPDQSKLLRLRLEAQNSANLAHPNIAALLDYYEKSGTGFLIMEYVDGPTLADIYKEAKKRGQLMSPEKLLSIIIQVSRGLYVAHSRGVVHRDIKPANIMLTRKGEVKITDFGVSLATNQMEITPQGMVVGTVQYISPEQAQGLEVTPQSDIYSLGVVLYEGLCGERPFTGATPIDIARAHVNDPVPPLPSSVDWRLRQYVMGMLAKRPEDRPRSALQVAQDLEGISNHLLDEQTASIPRITPDVVERMVKSEPVEPGRRMIDLTDPKVVFKSATERDPDDVFDVHFGPGGVEKVSHSRHKAKKKTAGSTASPVPDSGDSSARYAKSDVTYVQGGRRPGAVTMGQTFAPGEEYSFSAYGLPDLAPADGAGEDSEYVPEHRKNTHVPRHAIRTDKMNDGNSDDHKDGAQ